MKHELQHIISEKSKVGLMDICGVKAPATT